MKNYNAMTKKELIDVFKENTKKAHPLIKKLAFRNLMNLPKRQLIRYAKNGHTVRNPEGDYDISFIREK